MGDWTFPIGMEVEIADIYPLGGQRGVVISVDSDPMRRYSTSLESRRVRFHRTYGAPESPKWFALEALKAVNVVDALANLAYTEEARAAPPR